MGVYMPLSSDIEKREKQMANLHSFKKSELMTPEERERHREISVKGALARTEKQRAERTMREQALIMLNTPLSRQQAVKLIGDKAELIDDKDLTVQSVMNIAMLISAIENGNASAYSVLRDTSGQKPTEELNISADIITASDRALIDKIAKRIDGETYADNGQNE